MEKNSVRGIWHVYLKQTLNCRLHFSHHPPPVIKKVVYVTIVSFLFSDFELQNTLIHLFSSICFFSFCRVLFLLHSRSIWFKKVLICRLVFVKVIRTQIWSKLKKGKSTTKCKQVQSRYLIQFCNDYRMMSLKPSVYIFKTVIKIEFYPRKIKTYK